MAIRPTAPDPSKNTVECVTTGHEKASFTGIKIMLRGVCWIIVIVAFVMEYLDRAQEGKKQKEEEKAVKNAAVFLLYTVGIVGGILVAVIIIMIVSTKVSDGYFIDYCFCCVFCPLLFILVVWRIISFCCCGNKPEKYRTAYVIVYPSLFIGFHHLLWVLLGMITEPFWAFPIFVAISSVLFALFYLVYELNSVNISDSRLKYFIMSLSLAAFLVFSFFIFILVVVGQAFFSESLIAGVVQTLLILIITWWFRYLDLGRVNQIPF